MRELVFLLEEESAKALLEGLLPRFLSLEIRTRFIVFEGKQDLEKQLIRRLQRYANPRARFIVVRDQDSAPDCRLVKLKLRGLCRQAGREANSLVRIPRRELEAFYIADLSAVEQSLGVTGLASRQQCARFRQPDSVVSPSRELAKLTRGLYQKVSSSRTLGPILDLSNERSPSFRNLLSGIRRLEQELLGQA